MEMLCAIGSLPSVSFELIHCLANRIGKCKHVASGRHAAHDVLICGTGCVTNVLVLSHHHITVHAGLNGRETCCAVA